MTPLPEAAAGRWRGILPMLGVATTFLTGKHGPCPICDGKDRFRFDDRNGKGDYFCSGCGAGDGITLLRKLHGWSFPQVDEHVRPLIPGATVETRPRNRRASDTDAAERLWNSGRPLRPGDLVSEYLLGRGLVGPYSAELRFAPVCRITGVEGCDHLPAMLALVRAPDGTPVSVHRTYLDGPRKAAVDAPRRMMPGSKPKGCAIRLARHHGVLGVGEGIETAMAARRDFGVPCWAASNAHMLATFDWPADVHELHIFGDHDPSLTGHAATYTLANRALTARNPPRVVVHIPGQPPHVPPAVAIDWLDVRSGAASDAA